MKLCEDAGLGFILRRVREVYGYEKYIQAKEYVKPGAGYVENVADLTNWFIESGLAYRKI